MTLLFRLTREGKVRFPQPSQDRSKYGVFLQESLLCVLRALNL